LKLTQENVRNKMNLYRTVVLWKMQVSVYNWKGEQY